MSIQLSETVRIDNDNTLGNDVSNIDDSSDNTKHSVKMPCARFLFLFSFYAKSIMQSSFACWLDCFKYIFIIQSRKIEIS